MEKPIRCVLYARTSTVLKQDPEHQLVPLRKFAQERGYIVVGEFVDQLSGTIAKRPQLDVLIEGARSKKFDVVLVYALDRLSRDVRHLLNLLHQLDGYGVRAIFLRESIDFYGSSIGRAVLSILGSIAQLERDLISERIKTALAVKKQVAKDNDSGWRCGRPIRLNDEMVSRIRKLRQTGDSIRNIAQILGISKTSVQRALTDPVPKG